MNTNILTNEEIEALAKSIKKGYLSKYRERQKEYYKKYQKTHRKQLNEYHNKYMKAHPEKQKEYQKRYWNKKALQAIQDANEIRI